jgi:hypothetical protein
MPRKKKGQTAMDVGERNDIHYRIRKGYVQELGPNVCSAGPSRPALSLTVVEKGLEKGALTLHNTPSIDFSAT